MEKVFILCAGSAFVKAVICSSEVSASVHARLNACTTCFQLSWSDGRMYRPVTAMPCFSEVPCMRGLWCGQLWGSTTSPPGKAGVEEALQEQTAIANGEEARPAAKGP